MFIRDGIAGGIRLKLPLNAQQYRFGPFGAGPADVRIGNQQSSAVLRVPTASIFSFTHTPQTGS